jgi:cell wall assembly regulator SMI1
VARTPEAAIPLLSFTLLDELRLRLVEQKAPVVERLRPGLDDDELDSALHAIGLRPSRGTRIWWAWSGGVPAAAVQASADRSVGPGREYLEPVEAVALYRQTREIAGEMAADAATFAPDTDRSSVDWWWQPGWLPITTNGAGTTIACDCSVADGEPSPIHAVNWGAREMFYEPATSSFGQMVTWWIEALDNGAWRYDPEAGRWRYDWQLVDRERQLSGLV